MSRLLEKGKRTTKSISAAPCAALECGLRSHNGLKRSKLQNITHCLIMQIFSFLYVIDYVCNVALVCRDWSLRKKDILCTNQQAKLKLLKEITYNSFEIHLRHKRSRLHISNNDYLHEMETSIAFALSNTTPYCHGCKEDDLFQFTQYPAQPLYFFASIHRRRRSYFYLLHYIYLYKFGTRNWNIFRRMYALLSRIVFTGSMLCIGYMMDLYYYKFGKKDVYNQTNQEDEYNKEFWDVMRIMFHQFNKHHDAHVRDKPIWVLYETTHSFVRVLEMYAATWNQQSQWMHWPTILPHNLTNSMIVAAHKKYCRSF